MIFPTARVLIMEISLPQICMTWPESDDKTLPLNTYQPNPTTTATAEFILMPGYTEPNGETMTMLSVDFNMTSDAIQKLVEEETTESKLVVRTKAYDPMKLYCLYSNRKVWKFPKGKCQIKFITILAPQKNVDESAKDLEIRVDLRVECYRPSIPAEGESASFVDRNKAYTL